MLNYLATCFAALHQILPWLRQAPCSICNHKVLARLIGSDKAIKILLHPRENELSVNEIPNFDEVYTALDALQDNEEQLYIHIRSNYCALDMKKELWEFVINLRRL